MKRVLIFLHCLLPIAILGQDQDLNYIVDFISTKEGLSHNYVSSIVSDGLNMKWIGTENGITKFNGFDFDYIKPGQAYPELLNENIEALFMDRAFNLWIGTKSGGLSYLDVQNNEVRHFNHLIDLANEGDMRVTALSQDHEGNIWVGTWSDGVFVIDVEADSLLRRYPANQAVYSIVRDFEDNMWFCIGQRLNVYDPKTGESTVYRVRGPITDLLPDSLRNRLWIALSGKDTQLYSFNYETKTIEGLESKVPSNFSRKLSLDHNNRLWVGTWGKGVYRSNADLSRFDKIELSAGASKRISGNYDVILDVHQDKNNVTWLATANGGLIKLLEGNGFQNADRLINNAELLRNFNSTALYKNEKIQFVGTFNGVYYGKGFQDLRRLLGIGNVKVNAFYEHERKLYIGTADGFHIFDLPSGKLIFHSGAWIKKVTAFFIQDTTLYLGTQQQGLAIVNLRNLDHEAAYTWYSDRSQGDFKLESNRVTEIKKDKQDRIWVSTYNGLHLFDRSQQTFTHQSRLLEGHLPSAIVNAMLLKDGFIWLATPNGLIKLVFEDEKLHIDNLISQENGLNSDFICAITFDQSSNLWLSTHTEIVRYNEQDQSIISYGDINGVRTTSFNNKSFFNENQETLFFGGIDNITFFHPATLKDFNAVPEVIFTNLRVNNELIRFKPGHAVLDKNFNYAEKIKLTHKQDFFSVRFVANDFLGNLNIQYRYRLAAYQEQWIELQNRNEINFTGLPAGNYTLSVQASRDNQNWSPAKSIKIRLLSSPWVSPWALLLYALLVIAVIYYWVRAYNDRLKLENSLEIARIEKEKEGELTEAKLNFFTNISHEFRTPLTLIITPLKELLGLDHLPPKVYKNLRYIDRNTHRLLNLTNQLLDFRKADQKLLKLEVAQDDFIAFSQEVFLYFQEAAKAKHIRYEFVAQKDEIRFPFDHNKIEIVLSNLLSNALKYTPDDGQISLEVDQDEAHCIVMIKDTGIGMPSEEAAKIFDRFFQIKSSNTARLVGSGIGLAFSKEIIELHHGSITLDSAVNVGTTFTFKLSLDPGLYKEEMKEDFLAQDQVVRYDRKDEAKLSPEEKPLAQPKEHAVLIVDDNPEILHYLSDLLADTYTVWQAEDGQAGFEKASTEIPDLIICDVMMPGKDGITVCKELKAQITTSHIPVILLTARTSTVYEIEGLQTGADDYITKPFNPQVIKARIQNLLENREKLREHFLNKVRFEPSVSEPEPKASPEDVFIHQAISLVENNLDNPAFGIESMVEALHMSQSTLYRKIKSLTGLSLTAFIRSIRLKKSAELILTTDLHLNEIAYEVGFNDYKYFKNSFKKQFDCIPSRYKEKVKA
jgi:signal transduction histidine kinase/DNA-binding response OmpR family regulator/ligand-binding sensor domain-containing protein